MPVLISEVREQKDGSVLVLAEEEDDSDKEGLPHRTFARLKQGGRGWVGLTMSGVGCSRE